MGKASKKKARRKGPLIPPGMPSPERVREAGAAVIQPADAEAAGALGLDQIAERIGQTHPGLMAKLGQGLSRGELAELGPEIARAMHAAGAGQGIYTFTDQGQV